MRGDNKGEAAMSAPERWVCGGCGRETTVRHFLQREGVIVHDPDSAYREAIGLDDPEPTPTKANRVRHRTTPNFLEPSTRVAYCGIAASESFWRGTGSQDEYERLYRIPRCANCLRSEKSGPSPAVLPDTEPPVGHG